jgi:hypothetical protein
MLARDLLAGTQPGAGEILANLTLVIVRSSTPTERRHRPGNRRLHLRGSRASSGPTVASAPASTRRRST